MSVGSVDVGSNSIRLLIVDDDGRELLRRLEVTGLAKGVDLTGTISEEAINSTVAVAATYAADMARLGVRTSAAVATSAARDATNGAEAMQRIADALGAPLEIVSGEREADLARRGVTAHVQVSGPLVVIDIGGGSTEVIEGGTDAVSWVHSYDIGSVRLTDRCLPDRPASRDQIAAATEEVDRVFGSPPVVPQVVQPIGVAGTFTSLAAIHLDLDRFDIDRVDGTVLHVDDIAALIERLLPLTVDETAAIRSLEPKRAPVILAGAVVAGRVLHAVGATSVLVTDHDLLDGLALELRTP